MWLPGSERQNTHTLRSHLLDRCSEEDFEALGRVMDGVTDALIGQHPEAEIR